MSGKSKCARHEWFFHGSQKEKDQLKYMAGFGPINAEDEVSLNFVPSSLVVSVATLRFLITLSYNPVSLV